MKNKYLKGHLIILNTSLLYLLLSGCNPASTIYDRKACDLKSRAMKGRIVKVVHGHELVFYVDTIRKSFSYHFYFSRDSYRELSENQKGDRSLMPIVGDSIFKQAGSAFVKFKRQGKIFIEEIDTKGCD